MITEWGTKCQHCGHRMYCHVLDIDAEWDSGCYNAGCDCPGFEPRKEPTDADR